MQKVLLYKLSGLLNRKKNGTTNESSRQVKYTFATLGKKIRWNDGDILYDLLYRC